MHSHTHTSTRTYKYTNFSHYLTSKNFIPFFHHQFVSLYYDLLDSQPANRIEEFYGPRDPS